MNPIISQFKQSLEDQLEMMAQKVLTDNALGYMKGSILITTLNKCGEFAKEEFQGHAHQIGFTETELEQLINETVSKTIKKYVKL